MAGEQQPTPEQRVQALQQEVQRTSGDQLAKQLLAISDKVAQVKAIADSEAHRGRPVQSFEGSRNDADSMKAKAITTKEAVQRVLIAVAANKDIPLQLAAGRVVAREVSGNAQTILHKLSAELPPINVSEQAAPYIYDIIQKVITGQIDTVDALSTQFRNVLYLKAASPGEYDRVQRALIAAGKQMSAGVPEAEIERKFRTEVEQQAVEQAQTIQQAKARKEELEALAVTVKEHEKDLGTMLLRIRKSSALSPSRAEEVVRSLLKFSTLSPAEVNNALTAAGFSPEETQELHQYVGEFRRLQEADGRESTRYLEMYGKDSWTPEMRRLFSIEGIKDLLEDDPSRPGKKMLSERSKRLLRKKALFVMNKLMANADNNPDTDFRESFSDLREGYAYFELQTIMNQLQTDVLQSRDLMELLGGEQQRDGLVSFIKSGITQELARERSQRELFHTMGIYIKTLGPDKIAEFVARYPLSDVESVLTSDFSGKLVSLAMSEYERYLKFDIMKSKGEVRTSLFSAKEQLDLMYTSNVDRDNLRDRLRATVRGLRAHVMGTDGQGRFDARMREGVEKGSKIQRFDIENLEEYDDLEQWELDRALKYAQGIQLTQTIRGFEIIASSRPPGHFRGSSDNLIDMAAVLNPSWKWQVGRGGAQKMPRYREALVADMLVRRPEKSLWKRIAGDLWGKDSWDPHEMHEKYGRYAWGTEEKMAEKWAEVEEKWLYRDINFKKMIRLLGLGGLPARGGWRLEGFRSGIDSGGSEFEEYVSKIRTAVLGANPEIAQASSKFGYTQEVYNQLARSVGVGSRFFFDVERARNFAKAQLWSYLEREKGIRLSELPEREQKKLWYEYTWGEHGNEELFTLPDGDKVTFQELEEIKTYVFRGMNMEALMRRSPMDFLNSLINLTPELLPKELGGTEDAYFLEGAQLEAVLAAQPTPGARKELEAKIFAKKAEFRRVWGEGNYEHLRFVRDFYKGVVQWGKARLGVAAGAALDPKQTDLVWEKMYRAMDLAVEKVKLRNAAEMEREDIIVMKEDGSGVDQEATEGLRTLFFDAGTGLVPHFRTSVDQFGVQNGTDAQLGERGFFYCFGRGWYNELGHNFPPDTSDVDWRFILHNMGANSGQNMIKRLWGDLNAYNGVMNKLMGLDDLLAKCAKSQSLEEVLKLHSEIRGLKGIAGDEATYEMQYYLAQVVARYFQENSKARLPFLAGAVYGFFNGKSLSLSRIYGGMHAMTLTTDGLNKYFQELAHNDFIAEEGIYGFQRLSQALGADWEKLLITEIIPNVATALTMFLLYKYIKDALEEAEGKKKK